MAPGRLVVDVGSVLTMLGSPEMHGRPSLDVVAGLLGDLGPQTVLELNEVDLDVLVRIYRRRTRKLSEVVGDRELLATLENLDAGEVLAAELTGRGLALYLWFDRELSQMLGYVVGRDQRQTAEA